jgi:hypothetical protein
MPEEKQNKFTQLSDPDLIRVASEDFSKLPGEQLFPWGQKFFPWYACFWQAFGTVVLFCGWSFYYRDHGGIGRGDIVVISLGLVFIGLAPTFVTSVLYRRIVHLEKRIEALVSLLEKQRSN